jgi:DNA-binding IclR family transcriptional regulator
MGEAGEEMNKGGVAAVDRALSILVAFEPDGTAQALSEIAAKTGMYKSTILRLMISLERFNCVLRLADGRYQLGPSLFRWGSIYRRSLKLEDHVVPMLEHLVQVTGESASFYARDPQSGQRLCLFRQDSPKSVRDHVRAGDLLPIDRGAAGRVLREFADGEGASKRVHVVSSLGERDGETGALAVPIFGAAQALIGALSVSGPVARFTEVSVALIAESLIDAARRLTERLGGDSSVYERSAVPAARKTKLPRAAVNAAARLATAEKRSKR